MTNYYVDFVNGSDANNGLGPDASHVSNKPWKTITKLLGAAGMSSADTATLSPAGPFRETTSVAMTSAVAETKVLGDPWNQQGFKTSGGVLVSPGPVTVSGFTTNDKTLSSTTTLLNFNGRDFLTFRNIQFVGGRATMFTGTTATSASLKFEDCAFLPVNGQRIFDMTTTFGVPFNLLVDRCHFGPTNIASANLFTCPLGTGSDYDIGVTIRNSVAPSGCGSTRCWVFNTSGVGANTPGGGVLRNFLLMGEANLLNLFTSSFSTTIPFVVKGCYAPQAAVSGNSAQISEDYNILGSAFASPGAHTISNGSYAPMFNLGQDRIWLPPEPRTFGEPLAGSPLLAFGGDGSATATDILGLPRPATAALQAVGPYGTRHNTFTRDPSPIGGGGAAALKITGPGDYGFRVPVTGGGNYTVAIDVQWDATYAGTKPQLRIDANPRIGVAAETITATGSSGSPETITLTTINPTGGGFDFVIVRVVSLDTNGAGVVQSDDLTVT